MQVAEVDAIPTLDLRSVADGGAQTGTEGTASETTLVGRAAAWQSEGKFEDNDDGGAVGSRVRVGASWFEVGETRVVLTKPKFDALPESLTSLTCLEELQVEHGNIGALPPFVGQLAALRVLTIRDCPDLVSVPPALGELAGLERLTLWDTRIAWLPDEIGKLSELRELVVSSNRLECLPDSIGELRKLEQLVAFDNKLPVLPEEVDWPRLARLDVHKNILQSIPDSLCRTATGLLKYMDLSSNLLTELPPSIVTLSGLEYLLLADNQLVSLPEAMGDLFQLQCLQLNRNRLTRLPESAYDLTDLRQLNLEANPIEPLDDVNLWNYGDSTVKLRNVTQEFDDVAAVPVPHPDQSEMTEAVRNVGRVGAREGVEPKAGEPLLCPDHFSIYGCRLGDRCQFSHTAPPPPIIPEQRQKEVIAKERAAEPPFPYYGLSYDSYQGLFPESDKYKELFSEISQLKDLDEEAGPASGAAAGGRSGTSRAGGSGGSGGGGGGGRGSSSSSSSSSGGGRGNKVSFGESKADGLRKTKR